MAKSMTVDEVTVTEKVLRLLVERDPFADGDMEISFLDVQNPGALRAPGSCSARVLSEDPDEHGLYEVTISVRKISS